MCGNLCEFSASMYLTHDYSLALAEPPPRRGLRGGYRWAMHDFLDYWLGVAAQFVRVFTITLEALGFLGPSTGVSRAVVGQEEVPSVRCQNGTPLGDPTLLRSLGVLCGRVWASAGELPGVSAGSWPVATGQCRAASSYSKAHRRHRTVSRRRFALSSLRPRPSRSLRRTGICSSITPAVRRPSTRVSR